MNINNNILRASLSKHAKDRLKERYNIVATPDFMNSLHNYSKLVSQDRGAKVMSFNYNGEPIQYVEVVKTKREKIVATFLPAIFEGIDEEYIYQANCTDVEYLNGLLIQRNKEIRRLEKQIAGFEKQLKHRDEERKLFFNKNIFIALRLLLIHRRRYLKGQKRKKK